MPRDHDHRGRSLPGPPRNRFNRIAGQFAAREIEMLESPAYRVLSLSAHRALARIEIELAHHGGNDNGRLPTPYADFEAYGIDRHAIAPALRELQALGFIEITERGRAGNAEYRAPNYFRLTFKAKRNEPASNEWRKIRSIEDAKAVADEARRRSSSTANASGGKRPLPVRETHTEVPEPQ